MSGAAPLVEVIGLGQEAAGDDAVGLLVIRRLRAEGVPGGVALREAPEASAIVERLQRPGRVILVDAAVGAGAAGEVLVLDERGLEERGLSPLSSHGLDVAQAIALARVLAPDGGAEVSVVAVRAPSLRRFEQGLSPEVEAALPRAVLAVRNLVETPVQESP